MTYMFGFVMFLIFGGFDSCVGQVTKKFEGMEGQLNPFSDKIELVYCPCSNGKGI